MRECKAGKVGRISPHLSFEVAGSLRKWPRVLVQIDEVPPRKFLNSDVYQAVVLLAKTDQTLGARGRAQRPVEVVRPRVIWTRNGPCLTVETDEFVSAVATNVIERAYYAVLSANRKY